MFSPGLIDNNFNTKSIKYRTIFRFKECIEEFVTFFCSIINVWNVEVEMIQSMLYAFFVKHFLAYNTLVLPN